MRTREEQMRLFEARKLKQAKEKAEEEQIASVSSGLRSLFGVNGIWVHATYLQNTARSAGLTEDQIKSDVEKELRLAGIKVNSPEECIASEDEACLYMRVETSHEKDIPFVFYYVSVVFNQEVLLLRRPRGKVTGATWQTGVLGKCARDEFAKVARDEAISCVGMFIDNYRVANPKK